VNPQALSRVLGSTAAESLAKAASEMQKGHAFGPEKCPHCSAQLPDNRAVNFCPACGRSVTLIPCDSCGADLEPGWRFCTNCGQEVSEAGASPA
jgi:predicted amidophosphoribosyltransferase